MFERADTVADVAELGMELEKGAHLLYEQLVPVGRRRAAGPFGGRPRLPADDLYTSVAERLYQLPDETRVFVGHDYQPGGRDVAYESTVGAQKRSNVALPASRGREDFVNWRRTRDSSLAAPKLLFQSVQVNVDGGRLPEASPNKIRYLKIPINAFRPEEPGNMEYLKLDCHG